MFPTLPIAMPQHNFLQRMMVAYQHGHTWRKMPEGKFFPGFRESFVFDDARRPKKELGLGVWAKAHAKFYPLSLIQQHGVLLDSLRGERIAVYLDADSGIPAALYLGEQVLLQTGEGLRLNHGKKVISGYALEAGHSDEKVDAPSFVFTRWYGFAQTFPGCEIYEEGSIPKKLEGVSDKVTSTQ